MKTTDLSNDFETIPLSAAINHPQFDARLRELVITMAERPHELSIDKVVALLDMDAMAVAQTFIAKAVGAEVLRCRALDATKARDGLN